MQRSVRAWQNSQISFLKYLSIEIRKIKSQVSRVAGPQKKRIHPFPLFLQNNTKEMKILRGATLLEETFCLSWSFGRRIYANTQNRKIFTGNWFHIVQKKAEPHLLSLLFTFLCGYSVSHKFLFERKVKKSFQARESVEPASALSLSPS